ncbi:MAG: histidine decarboxylase [Verrucomicrobiales bacterium]
MKAPADPICGGGPPPTLSPADAARLDDLYARFEAERDFSIGYPCNQAFDYSSLYRFLGFAINNVGDPFSGSNFRMNTHEFEREVIGEFARLTGIAAADCWGYVTNGGTEGNMYGLYLARELFPDGIAYFSEDTHYSVSKILRLQHTRNIMIRSQPSGEMDYQDLEESLRIHRDVPPIIFANVGTTMKGAIDRIDRIREVLGRLCITQHYIHVDAAFSGMILPFVDDPPPWDFAAGADSLSISGHKFIGSPLPCGVALVRKIYMERVSRSVEYVGALDTTISGSRNAITPLFLWYALRAQGDAGFRRLVDYSLGMAAYAVGRLRAAGVPAWRHEHSLTVVFPLPPRAILKKWTLAPYRDICHLITLPNITKDIIDTFADDMQRSLDNREP